MSFFNEELNFEAICYWFSTGFFFKDEDFLLNGENKDQISDVFEGWYYKPKNIAFEKVVNQFSNLFESLIMDKISGKNIVLPLSGGLDSRTLAVALRNNRNVVAYSYEFEGGIKETEYARQIAEVYGWEFHSYIIPRGYLWNDIDQLSKINQCKTEFTHPRQMAVIDQISNLGEINLSGSMGDLLFDTLPISDNCSLESQKQILMDLIIKQGGKEIAQDLWGHWGIKENFEDKLSYEIGKKFLDININNPASRIRAFKALHYVRNWTNINMKVFSEYNSIYAPYQDNKMCEFICEIPEKYLANRKIQIEYIKLKAPELAKIPWQNYDLDLYRYTQFNNLYFPRRMYRYFKRIILENIFKKKPIIQRNWELQFTGGSNEKYLENWLFENKKLKKIIPESIIQSYYELFLNDDSVKYSHPISMLLTISVWTKRFWKKS
ncbi:MAG: asparagine synthase-related protein [Candidatus Neomarinimicrobiota bacterium]